MSEGKIVESGPDSMVVALVSENLGLVDSVARAVSASRAVPLDREEAFADGAEGLVDAARRFEIGRGIPFPAYAPYRIKGAIIDGERRFHGLAGRRRQEARVVSQLNNTRARSLDAPLHKNTTTTLHDIVTDDQPGPETVATDNVAVGEFYNLLAPLSERQRAVVAHKARRYTLTQIAAALGISERTVSRDYRAARDFILEHVQLTIFD